MEYLFVYGVFRDSGKSLLKNVTFCGRANVTGTIYRVNQFYPGFIREGNTKVWGDVYLIDESLFKDLDEFEGEEYNRKKIRTSLDIECWIYEWKGEVKEFDEIKCGDWLLR